jgi:hypothetical protein
MPERSENMANSPTALAPGDAFLSVDQAQARDAVFLSLIQVRLTTPCPPGLPDQHLAAAIRKNQLAGKGSIIRCLPRRSQAFSERDRRRNRRTRELRPLVS